MLRSSETAAHKAMEKTFNPKLLTVVVNVSLNLERLQLIKQLIHVLFLHVQLTQFVLETSLVLRRHRHCRLGHTTCHVVVFRLRRRLTHQHVRCIEQYAFYDYLSQNNNTTASHELSKAVTKRSHHISIQIRFKYFHCVSFQEKCDKDMTQKINKSPNTKITIYQLNHCLGRASHDNGDWRLDIKSQRKAWWDEVWLLSSFASRNTNRASGLACLLPALCTLLIHLPNYYYH